MSYVITRTWTDGRTRWFTVAWADGRRTLHCLAILMYLGPRGLAG